MNNIKVPFIIDVNHLKYSYYSSLVNDIKIKPNLLLIKNIGQVKIKT